MRLSQHGTNKIKINVSEIEGGLNQPIERPGNIGNLQKQSYSYM